MGSDTAPERWPGASLASGPFCHEIAGCAYPRVLAILLWGVAETRLARSRDLEAGCFPEGVSNIDVRSTGAVKCAAGAKQTQCARDTTD